MLRYLLSLLLTLSFSFAFSQEQDKQLVQFSGVIYDLDSNTVVPFVTLKNSTSKKAYAANFKGYFSFVANAGDTINFSSIGYKKLQIVIPQHLNENKFTAVVKMKSDNIILPVVRVFPWISVDHFKNEFLTLKFADDDLEIAKKNIASINFSELSRNLARDSREIQSTTFSNMHTELSNKNINSTYSSPLFSPLAWAAFIKQITEGDKNRKK